jgi:PAS domain S-box-containing protein
VVNILPKMETKEGIDALFQFATEGIMVASNEGEIVRINPSAEKLFGYEKDELLGKKVELLVPMRLASKHKDHRERYGGSPHPRSMGAGMELFGLKKDGSEFPVEISLSPYATPQGKFVIAFIVDITIRRQAESKLRNYSAELEKQVKSRTLILEEAIEELEKTKKELNMALEKEKELNELKSRFVSMASHEFRTPLTTMMSSLSLISKYGERNDLDNHGKHVHKIRNSIHNLTDILNDFLSVSKLEEGKVNNQPERLNLKTFMEEVVDEMQPMATAGQKITLDYSGQNEVNLDRKLLKNILFNLISNAIKFSQENGLIEVIADVKDQSVDISVKDHGIGIPMEDQKHLFERFFRGHNAVHIQGTGLGLNIVAKYAELINAKLDFESVENTGTTFKMTIPYVSIQSNI